MTMTMVVLALAGVLSTAGTRLQSDGRTLFEAGAKVTFGATYSDRAVKASISSPEETEVVMRTGKEPRTVFVDGNALDARHWTYDEQTQSVRLRVPAGNTDLQVRFDDVRSLAPFTASVPVVQCGTDWEPLRELAEMEVECASETIRGTVEWQGIGGIYRIRPLMKAGAETVEVTVNVMGGAPFGGASGEGARYFLPTGSSIAVSGPAPGFEVPLARVGVQLEALLTPTVRVPKDDLDWDNSIVVEGEAFAREGGGVIKKSTEHQNTHEGGCIFSWADPGHWIAWTLPVETAGAYVLTVVGASAEDDVLRSLHLDGRPLQGAALISMQGTGGWGRSNPDEWQPFRPVGPDGQPVVLTLSAGQHELRITNLVGHHFNVDCILLTPQK